MPALAHSPSHLLPAGAVLPRHGHAQAYATLVLEGGYEEAGEGGRWRVAAGDVLVPAPFSAHWDHAPRGARLLNLALPPSVRASAHGRVAEPDRLIRLARRDPQQAGELLLATWRPQGAASADAPDRLARALSQAEAPGVEAWSAAHGVARATAFRWFRAAYGVAPTRYRLEARARRAWRMILDEPAGLAELAAAAGYADQAHMSRDVKALTGRPPGAWRALQPSFKTAAPHAR
jgi:AraC-like DNA-binding protein